MSNDPGWQIIQEQIAATKQATLDALLKESDYAKMVMFKERYRSFDALTTILDDFQEVLVKSQEELHAIEFDVQLQQEYNPN